MQNIISYFKWAIQKKGIQKCQACLQFAKLNNKQVNCLSCQDAPPSLTILEKAITQDISLLLTTCYNSEQFKPEITCANTILSATYPKNVASQIIKTFVKICDLYYTDYVVQEAQKQLNKSKG